MPIQDGIMQLAEATGEALKGIRKASGKSVDPDVIRYESFSPNDFKQMMSDFGEENVLEYIREMETKRLLPIK